MNPINHADLALFGAVLAGEHAIWGFSNKEVTTKLHPRSPADDREALRRCQCTSRLIQKRLFALKRGAVPDR